MDVTDDDTHAHDDDTHAHDVVTATFAFETTAAIPPTTTQLTLISTPLPTLLPPPLTTLTLTSLPSLTTLTPLLACAATLTTLHAHDNGLSNPLFHPSTPAPAFPSLTTLSLGGNQLTSVPPLALPSSSPFLSSLCLASNPLSSLSPLLSTPFPSLTHLNVSQIDSVSSHRVFHSLASCAPNLSSLSLADPDWGSSPLAAHAQYGSLALHHLPALVTLDGRRVESGDRRDARSAYLADEEAFERARRQILDQAREEVAGVEKRMDRARQRSARARSQLDDEWEGVAAQLVEQLEEAERNEQVERERGEERVARARDEVERVEDEVDCVCARMEGALAAYRSTVEKAWDAVQSHVDLARAHAAQVFVSESRWVGVPLSSVRGLGWVRAFTTRLSHVDDVITVFDRRREGEEVKAGHVDAQGHVVRFVDPEEVVLFLQGAVSVIPQREICESQAVVESGYYGLVARKSSLVAVAYLCVVFVGGVGLDDVLDRFRCGVEGVWAPSVVEGTLRR